MTFIFKIPNFGQHECFKSVFYVVVLLSVCDLTLVVVQQSCEERFSLRLQFFADCGSFDQISVFLKGLQQLKPR